MTDQWLRYRISDLKAQIAAEEAIGRNSGLLHAAQRMVKHLERQMDMDKCYIGGCTCGKPKYDRQTEKDPKVLDESEKLNLSDWDKLNNEVTALFGNSRVHDKHILALFDKVGDLTMQDSIRGAEMSDLNERLGKLEGRLVETLAAGADSNIGVENIKREMREMKATPRDEKSMLRCEFCNRPADEHDGHVISAGEGYSSAAKEPILLGPRKRDPFRWCGVCKEACEGGDLCKGCAENADLSTASNQSDKMGRSCVSAVVTTVPAPASSPIGPLMTDDLRTRMAEIIIANNQWEDAPEAGFKLADLLIHELPELQSCPFCHLSHNECGCLRTTDE